MRTFTEISDTEGKTIEKAEDRGDCIAITFTDGTYTMLSPGDCCEDSYMDNREWSKQQLVRAGGGIYLERLGIMTKEEIEDIHQESQLSQKETRRAQYEMLKREFDPEDEDT